MTTPSIPELAKQIATRMPRAGQTRLVLVDGPGGAGKSTFARALAEELDAPIVSMDDLIPGWDGLKQGVPRLMDWIVKPLVNGERARYRPYDWETMDYGAWIDVGRPQTLIVEGVSSASREPSKYASFVIWVDAPRATRLARGIARDGERSQALWERWMAEERELFAAEGTERLADVRISSV